MREEQGREQEEESDCSWGGRQKGRYRKKGGAAPGYLSNRSLSYKIRIIYKVTFRREIRLKAET